jgi:hypothetical protein
MQTSEINPTLTTQQTTKINPKKKHNKINKQKEVAPK